MLGETFSLAMTLLLGVFVIALMAFSGVWWGIAKDIADEFDAREETKKKDDA